MNTSDLEQLKLEVEKKMGGGVDRQQDVKLLQHAIEVAIRVNLSGLIP
jgi:hypothetical protein